MSTKEKISDINFDDLRILKYPDPRLSEVSAAVETFDEDLRTLAENMVELMFRSRGVGLAAPQVGVGVRMFIASPSFDLDNLRVYINPQILLAEGAESGEEGCLSFPDVHCQIKRSTRIVIQAFDLEGRQFRETCDDLHARICQHENDHLEGCLLVDRMGSIARLSHRKTLQTLRDAYEKD